MNTRTDTSGFYDNIPVFNVFPKLMDPALYHRLPDDWTIGMADIVQSTKAIREKRYKAVNMAGAAVIAGLANAITNHDFPFVFGGDGASFAVGPDVVDMARQSLADTATWVREELDLTLRVALVPVSAVREKGFDVQVARFGPSRHVSYAMFTGGGLGFAEAALKRGEFAVDPSPAGSRPDLSGLSCRFSEIPASRGVILSLVIVPAPGADPAAFRALIEDITGMVEKSPLASRPLPSGGPALRWPPPGLTLEAHATRRAGKSMLLRRAALYLRTGVSYVIFRYGIKLGGFVPATYISQLVENSDFRKFDDALRMVLDCAPALADALEKKLNDGVAAGVVRYGAHRQKAAMMTCFTPSPLHGNHVHFIDGADGGYALAATALKATAA
jgi:hypothetical protein